jgi:iron-sulfur cluster assembly accessory protein|tara:strand:- start:10 stop:339 length:330 start_codon:yes stop_codon:yes gene_type:complete
MELTDAAISKAIEKTSEKENLYGFCSYIRIGVTGGGCAGYEYYIKYAEEITDDDTVTDYGKFKIVMDSISIPFLEEATLDWEIQGLNESFRIINPKETASCGCGVSIGF